MPTRQAIRISELVAGSLALAPDPDRWVGDGRPAGDQTRDPHAFAQHLADAGRRGDLAYITRELDAASLQALLDANALPLVLVLNEGGRFAALVLRGARAGRMEVTQVDADAEEQELELGRRELLARLDAGAALGPDRHLALVPITAPAETATHDGSQNGTAGADTLPRSETRMTPARRLLTLLAHERRDVGLVYLYAGLAGLFSLTLPLAVQMLTNLVMGGQLLQPVVLLMAFVVLGTLAAGGLQVTQLRVVEAIQQRLFARHALDFAFRLPRIRTDVSLSHNLPELMNRFFDVSALMKGLSKLLTDATTALLTILFGLLLLTFYHPWFIGFGAVLVLTLCVVLYFTGRSGLKSSLYESKEKYRLVHWLEEAARVHEVFKNAGRTGLTVDRADRVVASWLHNREAHFRVLVRQTWAMYAFKAVVVGALLVLGAQLVVTNQITIGQFVAAEVVIVTVLAGIEKLAISLPTFYDVLTSLDKIAAVPELPLDRAGGSLPPAAGDGRGFAIELRGLRHRYPGATEDALRGIDLRVAPGERVALTGFDGAGQTTLLRVITGLLDGWRGAVTIDGLSLHDLDHAALRERVSAVFSGDELFAGTIEENLRVGRADLTREDLYAALASVGLEDWIEARPDGLASTIVAAGRDLPSGIAIRLLLARAIALKPRLIVLDDFFQNLEARWRRRIIEYLVAPEHPWTLVAVTHDPLFLAACQRVCLMRDGQMIREGSYSDLRSDPAFAEVVPPR